MLNVSFIYKIVILSSTEKIYLHSCYSTNNLGQDENIFAIIHFTFFWQQTIFQIFSHNFLICETNLACMNFLMLTKNLMCIRKLLQFFLENFKYWRKFLQIGLVFSRNLCIFWKKTAQKFKWKQRAFCAFGQNFEHFILEIILNLF